MGNVKEDLGATAVGPGAVVVCRFPRDGMALTLALCLYVRANRDQVVVRKAGGVPFGWRHDHWRWAKARQIPAADVLRLSTERERSMRHVIGGGEGEKLTGVGAGELRR